MTDSPDLVMFGLLPRPEGRARSFVTSSIINLAIFGVSLYAGMSAQKVLEQHYEQTVLIVPARTPPPQPKVRPPRPAPPEPPKPKLELPRIERPKPVLEPKPVQMAAKLTAPQLPQIKQKIALAPQPKPALAAVHFGDTFGVTPNPNALRPATVAAIGDPNGGMNGAAVAPHGVVKSTGLGNSPGAGGGNGVAGRVASVGMPGGTPVSAAPVSASYTQPQTTSLEILSKPPVEYTAEARQLRIQGDVVLSVTFLASGQVVVHGVVHGLGHGLDEEAIRVAQQIHFRPATVNGRPVDVTTHVTITFQLA